MRAAFAACLTAVFYALAVPSVAAQDGPGAMPVRVFDAGEISLDRYAVIERLWTGTWRASLWIPTHDDAASAIDALTSKAAALGADGVVNLHCLNDSSGFGAGYYCYGLAIKLR